LTLGPLSHNGGASSSWFSTTPSSSDDGGSAGRPPIEVTITNYNSSSSSSSSAESQRESNEDEDPSADDGPTARAKSPDQQAEEEILNLQSELRAHHRHAAYSPALEAAAQLLELTTAHFGTLHPATASAYNNVGLMNKLLGKYGAAKNAYHEALRVYGEVVGKDHASYAAALSNLGMLERGRVLESESQEGEEDNDGNDVKDEEGVDLDQLRDENSEDDNANLSALERMQLNESAIEYFDEAYRIRLSELGSNHPHTITSRSQLGSAMAAAVITERKGRMNALVESELRNLKHSKDVQDQKEMEAYVPEAIAKAASKSASGTRLTKRRWEAAEEHLRGALTTAVDSPRGESVGPLLNIPSSGATTSALGSEKQAAAGGGGLTLPPKKDKSMSKKEQRKAEKERKRARRQANLATLKGESNSDDNGDGSGNIAIQGAAAKVTTLSAATAAQNLAVFLKNYCDFMRLTLIDDRGSSDAGSSSQQQQQIAKLDKTLREAHHLYEAALHVRSKILPEHHPEVVAAKFSLAELLDSPKVGGSAVAAAAAMGGSDGEGKEEALDGVRANALREEILSAYNVEERTEDVDGGIAQS